MPVERRQAEGQDPLTPAQRRYNMQRIRARDTKPELLVRRALHALGLRYRVHGAGLPGKPDLVLARWCALIFVHGCFWHGHDCSLGVSPRANADFWRNKIAANRTRDDVQATALRAAGWRVAIVWQCALTGRRRQGPERVALSLRDWLQSQAVTIELREQTGDAG
jgi:DNA mismatch endonuclease (patch repair protein)